MKFNAARHIPLFWLFSLVFKTIRELLAEMYRIVSRWLEAIGAARFLCWFGMIFLGILFAEIDKDILSIPLFIGLFIDVVWIAFQDDDGA